MHDGKWTAARGLVLATVGLLVLGALVGFLGRGSNDAARTESDATGGATVSRASDDMGQGLASGPPTTLAPTAAGGGHAAGAATDSVVESAGVTTGVDQKIIKTATLRIEVADGKFGEAFAAASRVAAGHGGFVLSSERNTGDDAGASGVLVLRVPVAGFDAARDDLADLGDVEDERITGQDVSGQIVDLEARLRSLTAQEEALRALMAKANTIGETIDVQRHLTEVRQQIEQLAGQKARLENQAALSTIRVELIESGAAGSRAPKREGEPSPLRDAVSAAVDGAETVVAGTIIVLGWAIPLAILAALGWLASRPVRTRLHARPDPHPDPAA